MNGENRKKGDIVGWTEREGLADKRPGTDISFAA